MVRWFETDRPDSDGIDDRIGACFDLNGFDLNKVGKPFTLVTHMSRGPGIHDKVHIPLSWSHGGRGVGSETTGARVGV